MLRRHEISDFDWERIKDLLPPENTGEGRPSKSNRLMLNGMLWIAKTGSPWRDLPERFGSWKTVYGRFRIWSKSDVFLKMFRALTSDADMQDLSIDSTSCKAHQHAAGAKKGLKSQTAIRT
jgi:transposase